MVRIRKIIAEGRRKREEGRRKREEGRRLKSWKKPKFPLDIHPWVYTKVPQET
ncbi:hypothetical protein [Okeania sp. KiyG1]|uniref:hypothetical protein n=1 Tax=Okeania sp. KiyG1 TaxID=2720165 RepID=UPI0019212748|nr:hypothetical protein [Okeania sp. KiyG1]